MLCIIQMQMPLHPGPVYFPGLVFAQSIHLDLLRFLMFHLLLNVQHGLSNSVNLKSKKLAAKY